MSTLSAARVSHAEAADAIEAGAEYIAMYGWQCGPSACGFVEHGNPLCMMQAVLVAAPYGYWTTVASKAQDILNVATQSQFGMPGAQWNDRIARGPQHVVEFMRSVAKETRRKGKTNA